MKRSQTKLMRKASYQPQAFTVPAFTPAQAFSFEM
jgi:hypothetical protein